MKRTVLFSLAALAALTFASCSSESMDEMGGTSAQKNEIGFAGYVGRTTAGARAIDATLDVVKSNGFGVFGKHNSAEGVSITMFQNERISWNSNMWTYTNKRYWPSEGNIDFLAYSPYQSDVTSEGVVPFTVNADYAKQTDLLYAKLDKLSNPNYDKYVQFTFSHALSKIGITVSKAVNDDANLKIKVKKITLSSNDAGTAGAFYSTGDFDLKTQNWSNFGTSGNSAFVWNYADGSEIKTSSSLTIKDANKLMVIPQDFTSGSNLYAVVEYEMQVKGHGEAWVTTNAKVSKRVSVNFEKGKAYNLNLKVGVTPIEFDVNTSITGWETAASTEIEM